MKIMGFHEKIVPQVLDGKISTWRLRDHKLKKGDTIAFQNSQTGEIFGFAKIIKVTKTTVGKINLRDKTHYTTYRNRQELIKAFSRHNPQHLVNEETPVYSYTYQFTKDKNN